MSKELREKIREITSETDGVQTVHYLHEEHIDQLESLFTSEMLRIIGEDEEPYHLYALKPTKRQLQATRNHLRAEQRQALIKGVEEK